MANVLYTIAAQDVKTEKDFFPGFFLPDLLFWRFPQSPEMLFYKKIHSGRTIQYFSHKNNVDGPFKRDWLKKKLTRPHICNINRASESSILST
jgi:hypothetical protein